MAWHPILLIFTKTIIACTNGRKAFSVSAFKSIKLRWFFTRVSERASYAASLILTADQAIRAMKTRKRCSDSEWKNDSFSLRVCWILKFRGEWRMEKLGEYAGDRWRQVIALQNCMRRFRAWFAAASLRIPVIACLFVFSSSTSYSYIGERKYSPFAWEITPAKIKRERERQRFRQTKWMSSL